MTTPGPTEGASGASSANQQSQKPSAKPLPPGSAGQDPWYTYAQHMFPHTLITPDIIAGLKKNMMTMINSTISQINARQAEAQKYNAKVAKGEE